MKDKALEKPKIVCQFNYKGFNCIITKTWMGIHCGYVGITRLSPKYYNNSELCDDINCHGGVTFQGKHDKAVLKYKSKSGNDFYWIGFDCAHYNDFIPSLSNLPVFPYIPCVFRDVDYCKDECKSIVNQILKSDGVKNE